MNCAAYRELAAAHADGVLVGAEREAAEAHATSCPQCAAESGRSAQVRELVRQRVRRAVVPQSLRDRIEQTTTGRRDLRRAPLSQLVLQGAIAAAAMISLALFAGQAPSPMQMVAADVHSVADRARALGTATRAPSGPGDMEENGWRVVGAEDGVWGPMRGTMTVYEADDGKRLVRHEMKVPPAFTMPPGGRVAGGRTQYYVHGVVLSLAQSGDSLSCLAARMSSAEFARRVTG